jgi:hypothetical protein
MQSLQKNMQNLQKQHSEPFHFNILVLFCMFFVTFLIVLLSLPRIDSSSSFLFELTIIRAEMGEGVQKKCASFCGTLLFVSSFLLLDDEFLSTNYIDTLSET